MTAQSIMFFIFCFIFSALTCFSSHASSAHAQLTSPSLKKMSAHVLLVDTTEGIKIVADVSGLKPRSVHGFHIHEGVECKGPDFKTAGAHLNPGKHPHSGPAASTHHLGDLGNLIANEKGVARTEVVIPHNEVKEMKTLIGKTVILHAEADDLATQPSGAAGERIACGIIKAGKL